MTPAEVLALPLSGTAAEDSGETTIGGYLHKLLIMVWDDGSEFSGKRPFGNSGWEWDLYVVLIAGGAIEGALDEDGYVDAMTDDQRRAGHALIRAAIDSLFPTAGPRRRALGQ